MEFKDLIYKRRKELGLTMEEVANECNVSKATVKRWESGEIANIRRDKIAKLAKALHTTPAYLMGWETLSNKNTGAHNNCVNFTNKELSIIMAYRKKPPIVQEMIDKMLDLSNEPAAISDNIIDDMIDTVNTTDNNIQKAKVSKQK